LGCWLGERVGPTGAVTVTELEPHWAASRELPPQVRLIRHDIVHGHLPDDEFDLVHAWLVLIHLPERIEVLGPLVAALPPGGVLVLEEFDCGWTPVLAAPDAASAVLFERVHGTLMGLMEKAVADPLWARGAPAAMGAAGLREVTASTYAEAWRGGGTGIALHRANTTQVAGRLAESG